MKTRVLINSLLLSLVVQSSLLLSQIPQGYKKIQCTITPMAQRGEYGSHPHVPGPKSKNPRAPKNQATSTNWAGYVAANNLTTPAQNSVSAVSGSWLVPSILPSSNNSYSAIWVGIDGYNSPTVEQIGTSHNYINGAVQHYAWFEMYPGGSYAINGFPLTPGDVISASVQYSGNSVFTMTLLNETRNVAYTIPTRYTKSTTALRKSAEWVVEAPWLNRILPLANFVTAYLSRCMATINGVSSLLNNAPWQNTSLEMVTNGGIPKAIPSSPVASNGTFSVTWQHQ